MTPAVNGAMSAGSTTLLSTMPKSIACRLAPTRVAPMRPPNRACDELEGRPSSHVSMFQVIAPISPAKMIGRKSSGVICSSRMMPCEMVLETSVDRNAPTRLRLAASMTATLGLSAPVAIGVAMAFAVSWKPLVKSKKSASTITSTTMRAAVSTVRFRRERGKREPTESAVRTKSSPWVHAPATGPQKSSHIAACLRDAGAGAKGPRTPASTSVEG